MLRKISLTFMCGLFLVPAIHCKAQKMDSVTEKTDIGQSVWVEFDPFILLEASEINIKSGEYRINESEWVSSDRKANADDKVYVRLKSSQYPNDVTICEVKFDRTTLYFKTQTANFEIPASTRGVRNINLGISGPDMESIGGPGEPWARYNLRNNPQRGSAVREGLIPDIKPLINAQIRDAVICIGGDGRYYLTGSTGSNIWHFNDGVELWVSKDLENWDYMGLVWTFEKDATWEKEWRFHNRAVRALWAPEIHYVKGNYFITHSMPPGGRGLLKSATGKPEGPYINALANDGYWAGDIDGSLFEDEDGTVYYLCGGGRIAKMKDDMSGLAEEPVKPILLDPDLNPAHHAPSCARNRNCQDIGHEGAYMFKRNGLYYLTAADTYLGRYSSMVAVSENIYGPYRWRHEGVPCGGGTGYFKDHNGQWWCSYFGNDSQSPFREMPAIVKVGFKEDGKIHVIFD